MKPVKGEVNWPKSIDPRVRPQGEVPKHRASKDTKRWCLGRVGRRHQCAWQMVWQPWASKKDYPDVLQLRCQAPGCNKTILESFRMSRNWPPRVGSTWPSRHDPSGVPAIYGPGLPADNTYRDGTVTAPDYVDVIGAP